MRFAKAILQEPGMVDALVKNQLDGKQHLINLLE